MDIDAPIPTFSKTEWIGKQRVFPAKLSDVPPELDAFYKESLKIPPAFENILFPGPNLTIMQFLAHELPSRTMPLIDTRVNSCFSSEPAIQDLRCLQTCSIPSQQFVRDAKHLFGQALLDGTQSIRDPNYKGGNLPLWVVQYWTNMLDIWKKRDGWETSQQWLVRNSRGSTEQAKFEQCHAYLGSVGWNTKTTALGSGTYTTTADFAIILSDNMVSTTIVDIMTGVIRERVQHDKNVSKRFEVVGLEFLYEVGKLMDAEGNKKQTSRYLQRLESRLMQMEKSLIFPAYLKKQLHFLAFEIDFGLQKVRYGK
jgi:hypothetical protein